MEGVSTSFESLEAGADWRERKAEASMKAHEYVAHIEGFDDMDAQEKIAALTTLREQLEDEGDNGKRFIVAEIARLCEVEKATHEYAKLMARLGVTV